jgi:2-dehydropantoate 2-reductase
LDAELSEAIRTDPWKKAAFICAHAGMTAAVRRSLGEIRDQQASWEMYRRILDEVCSVGRATGIELPGRTATESDSRVLSCQFCGQPGETREGTTV